MAYPTTTVTPNRCYAMYGWHATLAHVQFSGKLDDANQVLRSGSIVRLTSDLLLAPGVGNLKVMPMVLFSHPGEVDVEGIPQADPLTDKYAWVNVALPGDALAFPCNGGFEFVSSNFDANHDFVPNEALTSPTSGASAGKILSGTMYTNMIFGIVSRGVIDNGYGVDGLAFWTCPVFPTA